MNLNFNKYATKTVVKSSSYIRPYNIYKDVTFNGVEGPITGKRNDGTEWKRWDFVFSCPEGEYKEGIFDLVEGYDQRKEFDTSNGGKRYMPSDIERKMELMKYLVEVFAPTKIDTFLSKIPKCASFEDVITVFKKITEKSTIKTSMKFGGRISNGRYYTALPNFIFCKEKDDPVSIMAFCGDNLTLTAYELNKKKEIESAKPTTMPSDNTNIIPEVADEPSEKNDELDDILADL